MAMYTKQLAQAKKDKAANGTRCPELVPVRQSKTVDWERMPLDDGRVYLQVVGGEALEICHQMLAKREQIFAEGKKLWRQIQRQLKPKKGVLPHGAKVKLSELAYNGATVRISFDQPDPDRRKRSYYEQRKPSRDARAAVQAAYREFINTDALETWRVNSDPFSSGGCGEVYCLVAFNHRNKKGRQMRNQVRARLDIPSTGDLANELLRPKAEQRNVQALDFCRFVGPRRMAVPVAFNHGDLWFLTLPVGTKKAPPKELKLPRGTFKRLTMSQYWRMVEKQALEG